MKKLILLLSLTLVITVTIYAQAPQAFKYQAIARDEAGNALSVWDISLRISIIEEGNDAEAMYVETHKKQTNIYGLINLIIGEGDVVKGDFSSIKWGENRHYLKIEMDTDGGEKYKEIGISQLYSVPYALYAEQAGKIAENESTTATSQPQTARPKSSANNSGGNRNGTPNSKFPADNDSYLNVNTGNVGVGITSPIQQLDVNGNINIAADRAIMIDNIPVLQNKGSGNIFVGDSAGTINTTGTYNVAIGHKALFSNTTGYSNVAIGVNALYKNTNRTNLVAVGDSALYNHGTEVAHSHQAIHNTAIGSKALFSNTTGFRNTAIGYEALYSNTTANNNTAIGDVTLKNNSTGKFNAAIGPQALYSNDSGDNNVAIGYTASRSNTSGWGNICIGSWSNYYNEEGDNNIIIGYDAGRGASPHSKSGNIFIGHQAGYYDTTDNKLYIENSISSAPLIYGEFDNNILAVNGKLGVGTMSPSVLLHVVGGSDASLSDGGYIITGPTTDQNIVIDENEIMARNNGAVSALHLQRDGGNFNLHYNQSEIYEFTVRDDGKTGIGENNPTAKLHIKSDTDEDGLRIQIDGTTALKVHSNGSVVLYNASSPTHALQLENDFDDLLGRGLAYSWSTYSDSRIKSNQKELQYGLKEVMQLQPKSYLHHSSETNEDGTFIMKGTQTTPDIGFIAQEVQKVIPEVVSQPEDELQELWCMDYDKLIPVLTKAIQEQQNMIDAQQQQLDELRAVVEIFLNN